MKFFAKFNRLVKMAVAAVVVGSAMLIAPGGQVHAAGWCNDMIANGVPGVYLFSDIYYQGNCYYFTRTGDTMNLTGTSVGNDAASSMKMVGSGTWDVILYQHANIWGDSYHTTNSIPDFREVRMLWGTNLNDQVTSLTVWYR